MIRTALENGNRIGALTKLKELKVNAEQEAYLKQIEMYITNDDVKLALVCLDIMEIKAKPKIKTADQRPLVAATLMLEATTESFSIGDSTEEDLNKATAYMYECLTDMIKEERGV